MTQTPERPEDQFSGRLRLLADAAEKLGPALAPAPMVDLQEVLLAFDPLNTLDRPQAHPLWDATEPGPGPHLWGGDQA